MTEAKGFARYKDVDGDGIGYRTLPGTDHPLAAYFTRGSGHNEKAQLSERSEDWEHNMDRLTRKFETARKRCRRQSSICVEGAEIGIIGFGSTTPAIDRSPRHAGRAGIKTSFLRLRALPLNRDDQPHSSPRTSELLCGRTEHRLAAGVVAHAARAGIRHASIAAQTTMSGLPLTANWLTAKIKDMRGKIMTNKSTSLAKVKKTRMPPPLRTCQWRRPTSRRST